MSPINKDKSINNCAAIKYNWAFLVTIYSHLKIKKGLISPFYHNKYFS